MTDSLGLETEYVFNIDIIPKMEEEEEEVEVVKEEVIDTWDEWEREEEVKLETLIEEFEA